MALRFNQGRQEAAGLSHLPKCMLDADGSNFLFPLAELLWGELGYGDSHGRLSVEEERLGVTDTRVPGHLVVVTGIEAYRSGGTAGVIHVNLLCRLVNSTKVFRLTALVAVRSTLFSLLRTIPSEVFLNEHNSSMNFLELAVLKQAQ